MVDNSKKPPLSHPHFIQPILPGFTNHLSIPVSFYNEYFKLSTMGKKRKVELELRTGQRTRSWKVLMVGRKLLNGWREFYDEYELKVCYFLVFKYLGNLVFDVIVFDENECEIEYQHLNEDADEDVNVVEIDDWVENEEIVAKVAKSTVEEQKRRRNSFEMDIEKARIESYMGTMWPTYLQRLHFPSYFCVANNLNELCLEIIIQNDIGKVWNVKVGCSKRNKIMYTKRGWKNFIAENGVREGDQFEFRIVSKRKTPVLSFRNLKNDILMNVKRQKVTVIPALDTLTKHSPVTTKNVDVELDGGKEKDTVEEDAHKTGSSNIKPVTHFIKTSTEYSLKKSRLNICNKFARENDLETKCGEIYLQNIEGELWNAKLKHKECHFWITSGWKQFALANGLEAGRVFMMKIVEDDKELLTFKLIKRRLTPEDLINR